MRLPYVRYAVEANRRRAYCNSGSIPWQLNEPYPNASCTSAIDYWARPKAVYYAVARAYAPVHVTARVTTQAWGGRDLFEAELWASNAHEQALDGATLRARLVGADGAVYHEQVTPARVAANGARRLVTFACPLADVSEDVFLLDLSLSGADGAEFSRNRYLFSKTDDLVPLLRVPATTMDVRADKDDAGDRWDVRIENTGAHAALLVRVEDARPLDAGSYLYASDNDFVLLPGESVTIAAEWDDVPAAEQRLEVSGWNTATMSVDQYINGTTEED